MALIIWRTSSPVGRVRKLFLKSPAGRAGSSDHVKHTPSQSHSITFLKLALISCCCLAFPPPRTDKHGPGKMECSDVIIALPPSYSSLSLFFWVAGIWFYKPILSLALQLWARPVSWVTYEKHISPSLPSRSQPEHSSSVFMQDLGWKWRGVNPHLPQQLCFKSSERFFLWFPESIGVYIFLKAF